MSSYFLMVNGSFMLQIGTFLLMFLSGRIQPSGNCNGVLSIHLARSSIVYFPVIIDCVTLLYVTI
jgi:hypothetical protein